MRWRGGYSSSRPVESLRQPPRGPAPGATDVMFDPPTEPVTEDTSMPVNIAPKKWGRSPLCAPVDLWWLEP